jgi:DNA-binding response OmpR family regulator
VDTAPRIALIESDDLIRQLAARWLEAKGYAVHCTTAQRLRGEPPVQLIVANVADPRNAGPLVRALHAAHAAPIILISARFHKIQGASSELADQLGVAAVLAKPFTAEELQGSVAAALDAAG